MDVPDTNGSDRPDEAAPSPVRACQCEHAKHFSQTPGDPAGLGHGFLDRPAGNHSIPYLGAVCDECAQDCYPHMTQSAQYVWIGENGARYGAIADLAHEFETVHYSGDMTPEHVLTAHHNAWVPVTVATECVGADDADFLHYELTCSWADHNESIGYLIDGRA